MGTAAQGLAGHFSGGSEQFHCASLDLYVIMIVMIMIIIIS